MALDVTSVRGLNPQVGRHPSTGHTKNRGGRKRPRNAWAPGSKTYGYDAAGRTTSITTASGTTSLVYDYESRVTSITYPNSTSDTFTYNGLDTRVGKGGAQGAATFKRNGVGVTAPVLSDGSATFTPGISERRSGATTYSHSGIKNAEVQTSASQSVSATSQYDAFGNLVSSTGTWKGPFAYGGPFGYQSDASGLKLLGHRYYDSGTGRFLTRDPVKDGRNWYGYCANSPLASADPEGLVILTLGAGVWAGLGASFGGSTGVYVEPGTGGWGTSTTYGGGAFNGWDTSITANISVDWSSSSEPYGQSTGYAFGYDSPFCFAFEFYIDEDGNFSGLGGSVGWSPGGGFYAEKRVTSSLEIDNPTTGNSILELWKRMVAAARACLLRFD